MQLFTSLVVEEREDFNHSSLSVRDSEGKSHIKCFHHHESYPKFIRPIIEITCSCYFFSRKFRCTQSEF